MSSSLASQFAALPANERADFIAQLSDWQAEELLYDWAVWARPEQITPAGNWNIWLILAGRGWGKTRTGAEDVKRYGMNNPGARIGIIAPTIADARDTCVEGDSGLLSVLPQRLIATWNRSLGELILTNGTRYKLYSSEEPERLRGPQYHRLWMDELGAWRYQQETFDQAMFGLRLGMNPQTVITTTPRPTKLIRELLSRSDVYVTRGRTFDNAANLAPAALQTLKDRYEGTRLGRQELNAELLDDNPGALWTRTLIEQHRVREHPPLKRIVVAVDPPANDNTQNQDTGAEAGIIVKGLGIDNHLYLLADYSMYGSPNEWASAAITAYNVFKADRVVAEINNGGDMIETLLRNVAPNLAYMPVRATRGKLLRAEPVATLYERGIEHHVGAFPILEDQMCQWVPGEKSPDRLDANVWASTALMPDGTMSADDHIAALKARLAKQQQQQQQKAGVA